ncbi:MAG TPA: citrate/2-methylcitrate synthase, partial [Phycisphaerae bacterium]|nr:citrate/2-methylcitrate synthase [Phycisphaerae bacterium]
MSALHDKLKSIFPAVREDISRLVADHGDKVISEVTVAQAYGGMRGVKCMVCDTSVVDPVKGLILRGRPLSELTDRKPEEIFFLLLTNELPSKAELEDLEADLARRAELPGYVIEALRSQPRSAHPMAMFSMGILMLEEQSKFRARYNEGMPRDAYWEAALDDSLDLIAKLPALAAAVYRIRYELGDLIPWNPKLDWSANLPHMMGVPDESGNLGDLMRLYLTLHADHEGGNVSANLCHTAGSALSDPYYAVSAGLNGLAGPLHGLANQECLRFHLAVRDNFNGVPNKEQL